MQKFKAIMILSLGGVPLLLAVVILLGNLGDTWTLHVLFRDFTASRSVMILIAAFAGWGVCRLAAHFIPVGIRAIKEASAGTPARTKMPKTHEDSE